MTQIANQALLEREHPFSRDVQLHTSPLFYVDRDKSFEMILSAYERIENRSHVILDRSGAVLAMSDRTKIEISRFGCFAIKQQHLIAGLPHAEKQLQRLLRLPQNSVENAVVPCRSIDGHVILSATGLCDATILLRMQVADPDYIIKLVDLTEAFGLTPSEAHVVELLLGGHGPSKISDELGISVHTVRAHLRHCYDKLGVSSREELWQTLAPYHIN